MHERAPRHKSERERLWQSVPIRSLENSNTLMLFLSDIKDLVTYLYTENNLDNFTSKGRISGKLSLFKFKGKEKSKNVIYRSVLKLCPSGLLAMCEADISLRQSKVFLFVDAIERINLWKKLHIRGTFWIRLSESKCRLVRSRKKLVNAFSQNDRMTSPLAVAVSPKCGGSLVPVSAAVKCGARSPSKGPFKCRNVSPHPPTRVRRLR